MNLQGKQKVIPRPGEVRPKSLVSVGEQHVAPPGIYYDMPFEEYLRINAFHKSAMSELRKSPRHYWHFKNTPLDTKAIREGRLLETVLLEPELFYEQFVIYPDYYMDYEYKKSVKRPNPPLIKMEWSNARKYCQTWKKEQEARGKIPIAEKDVDEVIECAAVIASKSELRKLIQGQMQVTMVWVDPKTGVLCKARIDILRDDMIVDLKKTKDASYSNTGKGGFSNEILNFGYHEQGALYSDGWEVLNNHRLPFVFLAVEKFAPFECAGYPLREDSLITGRYNYRAMQIVYRDILEEGKYHGYPNQLQDIDIPAYQLLQQENVDTKDWDVMLGI